MTSRGMVLYARMLPLSNYSTGAPLRVLELRIGFTHIGVMTLNSFTTLVGEYNIYRRLVKSFKEDIRGSQEVEGMIAKEDGRQNRL